jgi:hypothetical protein
MVSGLGVPVIVPSHGSMTRHPIPSTGSPGVGSPASAVLRRASSPGHPSRRTSFPSLGGTVRALVLRRAGLGTRWAPSKGFRDRDDISSPFPRLRLVH